MILYQHTQLYLFQWVDIDLKYKFRHLTLVSNNRILSYLIEWWFKYPCMQVHGNRYFVKLNRNKTWPQRRNRLHTCRIFPFSHLITTTFQRFQSCSNCFFLSINLLIYVYTHVLVYKCYCYKVLSWLVWDVINRGNSFIRVSRCWLLLF